MLNRKSNEAPARAGIGTAHSTSATKTPARLPARRRIMASSFHHMTTASTRANVMPGGPHFKNAPETPMLQGDSSMLGTHPGAAVPGDFGVLSFRGDTPAASEPWGFEGLLAIPVKL